MKRQRYNRRWWVADPGDGDAGRVGGRDIRELRRKMRGMYGRVRIKYSVHMNPRMKVA